MRNKKMLTTMILAVLSLPVLSHAEYFVVMRHGEVRSGPVTDHPIVGTVKASEVFEIPISFRTKGSVMWIPIEWREVPKAAKMEGWFQISTQTEYTESGEVMEGWYLADLQTIRKVGPGEIIYFIREEDPEKLRYGEMLAELSEEKTFGGLLYKKARFKLKEMVPKQVDIEPETGRFYWFYTGGCHGETFTGILLNRLMQRRTCTGQTYELGMFKVNAGFETLYTKWVHLSLGERVGEPDVAHRLYEVRNSGFPMGVQEDILDRRIWRGMTREMARLSWGEPSWVNTSRTKQGPKEQWVYDYGTTIYYLHFRDGILDSYRKFEQGIRR